jgi:hypothetical protein
VKRPTIKGERCFEFDFVFCFVILVPNLPEPFSTLIVVMTRGKGGLLQLCQEHSSTTRCDVGCTGTPFNSLNLIVPDGHHCWLMNLWTTVCHH